MAYAVIRTGGKQYRVAEGETVRVDLLAGEAGDKVKFDDVPLIGGDEPKIGKPAIAGASVEGEIVGEVTRRQARRLQVPQAQALAQKAGHRQSYTAVKITKVTG